MNYVYIVLLVAALVVIEVLIGGTRLLFSLPSYGLLSLVSVLSLASFRRQQIPAGVVCLAGSLAFAGYLLARIICSPVPYLARMDLFMLLAALIVYLLAALFLTAPRFRFTFVMALIAIALVHVSIGAIEYLRGQRIPLFGFLEKADYGVRASGLYVCPNHLAGFLEVAALMGLSIVCWSRQNFWIKLAAGYGAIVCAVGILLTGSRGGYFSTLVGLIAFGLLSFRALRRAHFHQVWVPIVAAVSIALVLLAGAVVIFSSHHPIQSRLSKVLTEDVRIQIWKMALQQFKESPVVGTGAQTFRHFGRLYRPSEMPADPEYVHNDYLQLLAEYGVIGLALGLFFVGAHCWFGFQTLNYLATDRAASRNRLQSDSIALNIGAMSALSVYVVHSIFDFNLHIPANALVVAFVLGILANPGVAIRRSTKLDERMGMALKLVMPAAGMAIAVFGLPTLPAEYFSEQARHAYREERYEEAVKFAERGIARDPGNPYLHLYQGQAYSSLGEATADAPAAKIVYAEAVEAFSKARQLYPQDQWTLIGLGAALDGLGRFAEARPVYLEAIRWNPASAPIYLYFATHLRLAGSFDEAEKMYKKSIELYWNIGAVKGLELLAKARAENGTK